MKKLWTCVIDFRGGTYIHQTWCATPNEVLAQVLRTIKEGVIPDLTAKEIRALLAEVDELGVGAVPIENAVGVYCVSGFIGDDLLLANIVETCAKS